MRESAEDGSDGMTTSGTLPPLAGLRVVEFAEQISAPFCGKLLAGLGADVIKVEPVVGDPLRDYGPFPDDLPHSERGGLFHYLNGGKRSVTLDLAPRSGERLALELARWADIVVTDGSLPASLRGLLTEEAARDPALIWTQVSVFGNDGPHASFVGGTLQAAAGSVAYHLGDPDRAPLMSPAREAEYWGGLQGCAATLAAVHSRERDGVGQGVEISSLEAISTLVGAHRDLRAVRFGGAITVGFGGDTPRQGYHGWLLPWVTLPCKDGYVTIISSSVRHWQRYLDEMEGQDWTSDPRIYNLDRPYIEEDLRFDTLDALQMQWLETKTKAELFDLFGRLPVPFQPVQTIAEVLDSDHMRHRKSLAPVRYPGGEAYAPGLPFRLPACVLSRAPAPRLGDDNRRVYCEMLGLKPNELVALGRAGII